MKWLKRLGVLPLLLASVVGVYWLLGSIDIKRPPTPDLDVGAAKVSEEDNWYTALAYATNLVTMTEEEKRLLVSAAIGSPNWWRYDPESSTEEEGLVHVDAILARQERFFTRLALDAPRKGWWNPAAGNAEESMFDDDGLLSFSARILGFKLTRELQGGDRAAAFQDYQLLNGVLAAAQRGAQSVVAFLTAAGFDRCARRKFLATVDDASPEELTTLQRLLDAAARDRTDAFAQAYAREVRAAEARFDWLIRKRGAPALIGRFTFHFNRTLAAYYAEAVQTHACLLAGRYDAALRAQEEAAFHAGSLLSLFVPNGAGAVLCRVSRRERPALCRLLAADRFELAVDRVVVAAARYRRDHGGNPSALQDLVPDYLAAVPDDPFGNGPLGYNAGQGTLHSVGETGSFDGVIPPQGVKALRYTDHTGTRRWYRIRSLDGKELK